MYGGKNTMGVYSNIETYLVSKRKDLPDPKSDPYAALIYMFNAIGVDLQKVNTLFLPSDVTELTHYAKPLKDAKDNDEYQKITRILMAHVSTTDLHNARYAGNASEFQNKLGQIAKISPVSNGSFTLYTGPELKTEAKCKFVSDFVAAKDRTGTADKPICVVEYSSGEISTDGKMAQRTTGAADEIVELEFPAFVGASENCDVRKCKSENFKMLLAKGKGAFIETMAGLLVFLSKTNVSELDKCKEMVASLASYDAYGMYITLICPHGPRSLIPDRLIDGSDGSWCFSIAHSGNYTDIVDNFVSSFSPKIDVSKRDEVVSRLKKDPPTHQMGQKFMEIYKNHVSEIYGNDYMLSPDQLLWAHEVLYKSACRDEIDEGLAINYSGEKEYSQESNFSSFSYNRTFINAGLFSAATLYGGGGESPLGFLQSQYFLKYALVADLGNHKKEMDNYTNPADAKVRSFCLINS